MHTIKYKLLHYIHSFNKVQLAKQRNYENKQDIPIKY